MLEFIKKQKSNPFLQIVVILILMTLFMMVSKVTAATGIDVDDTSSWEIMASFVLFYTLVNCVFSLQSKDLMIYFRNSIFSFIALLVIGGGISYAFSGIAVNDAGSIKWILTVFSIGYLVFLSIVNLMRYIVELAQKQDKRLRGEE